MSTNVRKQLSLPLLLCGLAVGLLFNGCSEKKTEPVTVGEMVDYKDPGIGWSMKHAKGWIVNAEVGRARFYNAQDVVEKFIDPVGGGANGVEIAVDVIKTPDPAAQMASMKSEIIASGIQVGPEETITIGGRVGVKFSFTANYGAKNIITGHRVFVLGDSTLFELSFSGFGGLYEAYNAVFAASFDSFVPPKPKEKGRDETLPSDTFADNDAKMFTFQYPDNFNFTNPQKGTNELVVEIRGVRQDCNIRFEVFGAKGLTVEKVFDQNKGKFRGASTGKTTIGGETALYLTYPASNTVDRRFYFVVKNDKVFRIMMDWYKPQASQYLAAYEKVVGSIKFK